MEDPSSEWEMEEYYSSEDGQSKVSWLLDKGLGLGKKIVITGIVISAAPLVLPPLVVISALGFAVSFPFGLVFASYACTEKLMSMLLPTPEPPLLEYGTLSTTGEEDGGFGGEIDMEKEEEEEEEKADMKGGVEMRIELVGKGSEEPQAEVLPEFNDDYRLKGVDEGIVVSVEEEGYEEDAGEYLDRKEKEPLEGTDVKIEGMKEEEEEEQLKFKEESKNDSPLEEVWRRVVPAVHGDEKIVYVKEVEELVEESGGGGRVIGTREEEVLVGDTMNVYIEKKDEEVIEEMNKQSEDENVKLEKLVGEKEGTEERKDEAIPKENKELQEELARETTGLLEKIGDEGNVDNGEKEDEMLGAGERDKNVSIVEKMDRPSETKHGKLEKLFRKKKGRKGKRGAEALQNKNEMGERIEETMDIVPTEVKPVAEVELIIHGNKDGNNADNVLAVERPYGDSNVMTNGRRVGGVVQGIEEERKALVDDKSVMQGVKAKDQVVTDVHEGLQSEREKENVINSNVDVREIADESGLHLFDNRNEASYMVYENPKEESAEFLELRESVGVPESKHAGISSEIDIAIPSKEVLLSKEKIWEQMDAMRRIVGYKAAPQSTCLAELKALYIFTGIEPPASFKNPSDLAEVNHKLRFLMSKVGVK